MITKQNKKAALIAMALCGAVAVSAGGLMAVSFEESNADESTTYYSKAIAENKVFDFADTGLVQNPKTDTYSGSGQVELWGANELGTTVDSTFKMSFFFSSDERGGGCIAPKIAGWSEDLCVQIYPDGNFRVGDSKNGEDYTALPANEVTNFVTNVIYDLDFTFVKLYSDAAFTTEAGLRATAHITSRDGSYDKSVVKEYIPMPATTDLDYTTGGWRIWMSTELQNAFVCSTQYTPAAPEEPDPYYTKGIADNKVFDFADTGLVQNPKTDTYSDCGRQVELWENGGLGTTVDSTFKMSFFFSSDTRGYGIIAPKIAGWGEDLCVQIQPDGNFKVGDSRNGEDYAALPASEVTKFVTNVIYDLDFTFVKLYSDEACTTEAGLRATARITARDGSYDKKVVKEYIPMPATTDLDYTTGGWRIWMSAELQNAFVCSTQYTPPVIPDDPIDFDKCFAKAENTIETMDISVVGFAKDPVTDYDDKNGFKEYYGSMGPGLTVDKKMTAAFKFADPTNDNFPISFRRSGWSEDLRLDIFGTGKIRQYKNNANSTTRLYEDNTNYTAFTADKWYYLEYTVYNLYTDEAMTNRVGLRCVTKITDKADYNVQHVVNILLNKENGELEYNTGNLFWWIPAEINGAAVASAQYDPTVVPVTYSPKVEIENAPKIDISEKIPMNAAGLSKELYCTKEADGYYGNKMGVYEMNKTLCFGMKGKGSIHFAISGEWIWAGYRVDVHYNDNAIQISKSSDDYGTNYALSKDDPLDENKIYYFELTVIEYIRSDNNEKAYEKLFCKVYYLNEEGKEVVILNEANEFDHPGQYNEDNRSYFGVYMGLDASNDISVYPVNFKRDYSVTIVNGDSQNPVACSYGEAYDFTQYAPAKEGYNFEGWQYYIGGEECVIPSVGTWKVDFTDKVADIYSGTLTALYTPVDYAVDYVITGGTNSEDNPAKINIESGVVTLADPTVTESGFVFFGWYSDEACTQKITTIEYTGEAITVYAKIAEGISVTIIAPDGTEKTYAAEKNAPFTLTAEQSEGYGEITAWEVKDGEEWKTIDSENVTPAQDSIYRAVAKAIDYTITYDLDGGVNAKENPASYTVKDEFTFASAEKEGYFFVGWYVGEENVRGIVRGTTGELTLKAKYVENKLPNTLNVEVSDTPVQLPFPAGLPQGGRYSFVLQDDKGEELTVTAGSYAFAKAGNYELIYTITLPVGRYTHKIAVVAETAKITLNGSYEETYTAGSELTLVEATCNIASKQVSVSVAKDGETVTVTDGKLTLEKGTYTVTYSTLNAENVTVTFTVNEAAKSGGCGSVTSVTAATMMIGIALFTGVISKKNRKEND